ncbi:thioesterase family protein [uncultured Ferrimonas sp.]|uniref:thioesterase family protein n=1 Tax=uncultured Ferrimonas sp. TaxID=432640 RepID=UPI0026084165|nr:thioesterase family protein [uncultured Ferrimonas sp.]
MAAQSEQILAMAANIFLEKIAFHKMLQLQLQHYSLDRVELAIDMRPELMGNPHHQILHGGVTATLLDGAAGMTALAGIINNHPELSAAELATRLSNLGTIDMRVDYLRPGRGNRFIATGQVIRTGNKVAVIRSELHNEDGEHIAFGTCTYLVG